MWELKQVKNVEFKRDRSNITTIISWRVPEQCVLVDIFTDDFDPIISFTGNEHDVRISGMRFLEYLVPEGCGVITLEHASYLGREIYRASIEKTNYVQF